MQLINGTYNLSDALSISITYRIDQLQAIHVMFPKNIKISTAILAERGNYFAY